MFKMEIYVFIKLSFIFAPNAVKSPKVARL